MVSEQCLPNDIDGGSVNSRQRRLQPLSYARYLEELSIITPGLTGGGGTGKTVISIQSGRAYRTSNPRAWQSSSLIRFRISYAFSAEISCNERWLKHAIRTLPGGVYIQQGRVVVVPSSHAITLPDLERHLKKSFQLCKSHLWAI